MSTLLILGCGPGVGLASAKAFAKSGRFRHIALSSRDANRLNNEAEQVLAHAAGSNLEVHVFPTDLNDFDNLRKTIEKVKKLGDIEAVLFNAARIKSSEPLKADVKELEEDFRSSTLALYVAGQELVPVLAQKPGSSKKPAFIVTNSHLPENPIPEVLHLSVVKAAQQNMMQSFDKAFGNQIQFTVIKIQGVVGREKGEIDPETIARRIVTAYESAAEGASGELLVKIDA